MTKRRVVLDENLPHDLRPCLPQFDTYTAAYAKLSGLKNGQLLDAAEKAGFEVLVTGDQTLHYEQNLQGRNLAIVSLSAQSWPVIEPHVDKIAFALLPLNGQRRDLLPRLTVGSLVARCVLQVLLLFKSAGLEQFSW